MRIRAILLTLSLAALAGICAESRADERSAGDLDGKVSALIEQLDANRLSVRRDAERQLLKLGPAALRHFPPPELVSRPGVRQTLNRLRLQLEQQQARSSIQPSHVILNGRFSLRELIAAVEEQTGNRLNVVGLSDSQQNREIDITLKEATFWQAVDTIARRFDSVCRFPDGSSSLRIEPIDESKLRRPVAVAYSGPFRVTVQSARRRREFNDVRLMMEVSVEPRLRPLFLSYAAADWTAATPNSQQLASANPGAQWELSFGDRGRSSALNLDLAGADEPLQTMSVRGKVNMVIAAGTEPIRFSDILDAEGTARRRGGVTVTLQDVDSSPTKSGENDLRIRAAVEYDAQGPAFESHRTWIYHNDVFLESPDGKRINFGGGQRTSFSRTAGVLIEYPFQGLPSDLKDYRFVYVAPTMILDKVPVNIEFEDLPVQN